MAGMGSSPSVHALQEVAHVLHGEDHQLFTSLTLLLTGPWLLATILNGWPCPCLWTWPPGLQSTGRPGMRALANNGGERLHRRSLLWGMWPQDTEKLRPRRTECPSWWESVCWRGADAQLRGPTQPGRRRAPLSDSVAFPFPRPGSALLSLLLGGLVMWSRGCLLYSPRYLP